MKNLGTEAAPKLKEDSSVLIVGIVRDVEKSIRKDYLRFTNAFSNFRRVSWFLVESDSKDKSVQTLNELTSTNENFEFTSLGNLQSWMLNRTQRMAFARNRYLEEARNRYFDYDFIVVADFNNLNKLITSEKVSTSWERTEWEVVTANQEGPYYDVWALRHELWSPNDCWQAHAFFRKFIKDPEKALYATVNSRMFRIPKSAEWIQVESAFGGLGIYKTKTALESHYSGLDEDGKQICEHVPFHRQITASGGRIFINPALTNMRLTDHSRRSLYLSKSWRRLQYPYKFFCKLLRSQINS